MASFDITVRGAGIFGLSIAWVASLRGASVQIVDPNGAAAGASGGIVGALAPHVPEKWNAKKAFQLASLLMAARFWPDVEAAGGGQSGYARNGRLQPIQDQSALELAMSRASMAKDLWKDHAVWDVIPATGTAWEPDSPSGYLIYDSLSALIHPRQACDALVKALGTQGVFVVPEATDVGLTLWANGVHGLNALSADQTQSMGSAEKGQAALLEFDARDMPQLFASGVHVIPHQDGTVAVGSTSERQYANATETDTKLDTVIAKARAAVPALQDARVLERWAGLRPRARSRAPMLGNWPGRPDHFVANGGFKIGFGMAPKIAEVMVDLMLEQRDEIPDGFRVEDNL